MSLICKVCGKEYTNPYRLAGHLSMTHSREEGFMKGIEYSCLYCGKKFRARRSEHRKFCSRTCSNQYNMEDEEIVRKISDHKRGKTWAEIYGKEYAKELKKRVRVRMKGNPYGFQKGLIPWNKGISCSAGKNNPMYGKTHANKAREKMKHSWFKEGQEPWNKGYGDYMKGESNPNWHGGISSEPYGEEFNEELKEDVKEIYGFKCYICHITEEKSLEEIGRVLIIHHIDFNKKNNQIENLIPLCYRCHGRITLKREIIEVKSK